MIIIDGFLGWTTRKQSKKLLEAGLDPNTADMFYQERDKFHNADSFPSPIPYGPKDLKSMLDKSSFWSRDAGIYRLPCWSLGSLISILPAKKEESNLEIFKEEEELETEVGNGFTLIDKIDSYSVEYNKNMFRVSDIGINNRNFIDSIVEMIIYLIKEKVIGTVDIKDIFKIEDIIEL